MLWRADQHEPLADRPWDPVRAREAIDAIVADAEAATQDGAWPVHPEDDLGEEDRVGSIYLGSAGMVWALWRLGSPFDGSAAVAAALHRYRAAPDFGPEAHRPSLLMGETGLLVVADRLGSPAADPDRLRELVRANRRHPSWELMWGSPGTMLAARACGFETEWRESAELLLAAWDGGCDMWRHQLGDRVWPHLGPVHGFAGNVHALRGFVEDDVLRARTERLLTRTAARQDRLINWPPVDRPWDQQRAKVRVQWCHGAPGILATIGDLMPAGMALAAGELTWRAGPLRKGAGLCHGTVGNGFALLRLHALSGEVRWLERARRFGMHAIEQLEQQRRRFGRGRYSLWTGDIGVALYLRGCLEAVPDVPIIDVL